MRGKTPLPRGLLFGLVLLLATAGAAPAESLAIFDRGEWKVWWNSEGAPTRWRSAHRTVVRAIYWNPIRPGAEIAEVRLAAPAPALRLHLTLVRINPAHFEWDLADGRDEDGRAVWGVAAAPAGAAIALNAGQFAGGRPWGWLVRQGMEAQAPGHGPLSMAFVVGKDRTTKLLPFAELEAARRSGRVRTAFQSYPTLLEGDGIVPTALQREDRGVDLVHRDSRLALGMLRDGRILIALTRFDIGGGMLRPVPIGPNVPEMAAIMGALGCRTAVMLDGGVSSQLLVRSDDGEERVWRGYRRVPLGLVATPAARRDR